MKSLTAVLLFMVMTVVSNICLAICVENQTDFKLHFDIQNQNRGRCTPRVKHYAGTLKPKQKKCFAHDTNDPDWSFFRYDRIIVDKVDDGYRACNKMVTGILNTLEVSYLPYSQSWWCLDRNDYED